MNMPTAAVGSVLTYERLTMLLQQEPPMAQLALHYVGAHERRDLLEPLRRMADTTETEKWIARRGRSCVGIEPHR